LKLDQENYRQMKIILIVLIFIINVSNHEHCSGIQPPVEFESPILFSDGCRLYVPKKSPIRGNQTIGNILK
jgi:hypothetical protein